PASHRRPALGTSTTTPARSPVNLSRCTPTRRYRKKKRASSRSISRTKMIRGERCAPRSARRTASRWIWTNNHFRFSILDCRSFGKAQDRFWILGKRLRKKSVHSLVLLGFNLESKIENPKCYL